MNATRPARVDPERLRIRHVEPSDYEAVKASMGSPLAYAGTLQLPMTSSESWRRRLAEPSVDSTLLVAEVKDDADRYEVVASAGLHATGPSIRRRHVAMLGIAVRDDWQGRGIGHALMAALLDRADNWMNLLRIELTVFTDNTEARRLYERFGFVVEGVHRAYALRAGVYADVYAMATSASTAAAVACGGGAVNRRALAVVLLVAAMPSGCAVVAVVDTAATVAVKTVGVAADAAVGTVKIVGKGVGKAADAMTGSDKEPR